MMEPMTALVLAFQLLAIFSIAGALIIYLICKVREDDEDAQERSGDLSSVAAHRSGGQVAAKKGAALSLIHI